MPRLTACCHLIKCKLQRLGGAVRLPVRFFPSSGCASKCTQNAGPRVNLNLNSIGRQRRVRRTIAALTSRIMTALAGIVATAGTGSHRDGSKNGTWRMVWARSGQLESRIRQSNLPYCTRVGNLTRLHHSDDPLSHGPLMAPSISVTVTPSPQRLV